MTAGWGVGFNEFFGSLCAVYNMTSTVYISVIVCTRNRSDSIEETLKSLVRLDYPEFEILVVDGSNGRDQTNTKMLARQYGAKYIPESRPGLSLARNTGIANATGEIIAFTDDDCIPARDWLKQTVKIYSDQSVWAGTGRVLPHFSGPAADLFEAVAGQDLGSEIRRFTPEDIRGGIHFILSNASKIFSQHMKSRAPAPFGIGHGSSLSFRRLVFDRIGLFDLRFGAGAPLRGCDDIEMLYRVLKSGHSVVYDPQVLVSHKHRLTSGDDNSSKVRNKSTFTVDEVFKTRYAYSFSGAGMMREFKSDGRMRIMFYGRLMQLIIKTFQYKLTRNKEMSKSFSADLHGFLDGWRAHKSFNRQNSNV